MSCFFSILPPVAGPFNVAGYQSRANYTLLIPPNGTDDLSIARVQWAYVHVKEHVPSTLSLL